MQRNQFLSVSPKDLKERNISQLDVIIITGDAYVDHPSFGAAIVSRYLEMHGYTVGIIAQPDINDDKDFLKLGKPKLFFGITAGNLDSMLNHYTAQRKIRSEDAYSAGGIAGKRPDRASIVYSQKIRKIFGNVPIILGGIEASMRRIPHYDFWSDKIRNSLLFDSQADILVYGMGEKAILEIAQAIQKKPETIPNSIRGTVVSLTKIDETENCVWLPAFEKNISIEQFAEMHTLFEKNFQVKTICQQFGYRFLRHNLPAIPLSQKEIDTVYAAPFTRQPHIDYQKPVPAFEQIKLSVTSHRGCFGGCHFCSIGFHQGKTIQSRSQKSIKKEVDAIISQTYFSGVISDVGGPSANMYSMNCALRISETCQRVSCLYPEICPHLNDSHDSYIKLLDDLAKLPFIKHLFIASGIRFDLALRSKKFIKKLTEQHVSGLLKVAPEHKSNTVLQIMNKPNFELYQEFVKEFFECSQHIGKKQGIVPYIIVGHPGATMNDEIELAIYLKKSNIRLQQIQEFIPLPMTRSALYYVADRDENGNKLYVAKGREIRLRKALIQWYIPANRKYIIEALKLAKREDVMKFFLN
jgi:uncharacterized radical SAM protein YgiQ